jgi:hypothetical protein
MLQFKNETPFVGTIYLLPDPSGVDTLFAVIKGTFQLNAAVAVADDQVPVTVEDKYHGEPGTSSIQEPSDVALIKPGTDLILLGSAHAPGGRPTTQMDIGVTAGPLRKAIRVIGDRVWKARGVGPAISAPEPFLRMPLTWERAFGGFDQSKKGVVVEPRNPVGSGFRAGDGERALDGLRLPNLEDPSDPITSWRQRPSPVCFAPVAPHWRPRVDYAGTYDERWQQERAPFLPADFDPRFFQLAPAGLSASGYFRGGEPVELRGMTVSGILRFFLPRIRLEVTYRLDQTPQRPVVNLDTVLVRPDQGRLILVWRTALACDKKALRVSEVRASLVEAA